MLGEVHYEDLPGLAADFDVCLIPFVRNELSRSVNPVKAYEYFALGKPVVSTILEELAEFQPLVSFASNAEEFVSVIEKIVPRWDEDMRLKSIQVARSNSWNERVRTISEAIGIVRER